MTSLDICLPEIPVIIVGEDVLLDLKLINAKPPKDPFDLTGVSEIVAKFLNADSSVLSVSLTGSAITVISAPGGHLTIALSAAQTALLNIPANNAYANFELYITIAGKLKIVQFPESLNVLAKLFP